MTAKERWRFWAWPSELREKGILGINRRNGRYVLPANPRASYPSVDEKHRTKVICKAAGIPVPETYLLIERCGDVRKMVDLIGARQEFVIKPAAGSAGRGILVIAKKEGGQFFTSSGQSFSRSDLEYHVSTILSGLYSLAGQPDFALVEQRIVRHEVFDKIAVGGTPDIRVVLYKGMPAMAMVRLPTHLSRGKANLHQGAAGAGVHLRSGTTFGGVCLDRAIVDHPDTGNPIAGVQVPFWNELLVAAMKLAGKLNLKYIGVDFVVDANLGPVVLEGNARPGLNIQVANRCGLVPRLRFIDNLPAEAMETRRDEVIAEMSDMG
jgi:alpha-L-glutamate ligase-like protein